MRDMKWLLHRLKAMDMQEVVWRVQQKLLQKVEYQRYYTLHAPVTEIPLPKHVKGLKPDARRLLLNTENDSFSLFQRVNLFGFDYQEFKSKWNVGFQTDNCWPEEEFSYHIAISQREDIGDIRTNWELNRHYQFVGLAKNYYVTGDAVYLKELAELFENWNRHNLFLHGVQWTSAMEVAVRSVSWSYTYVFLCAAFEKHETNQNGLLKQLHHGILVMTDYIIKHRARYSSANNHLIVEMFAIGMAGILFNKKEWITAASDVLTEELGKQNSEDGVNKEMSLHYQCFIMEAYGILALTMEKNHIVVPLKWRQFLSPMSQYLADCCGEYGEVLIFGDNDEGKLLDLQGEEFDYYRYVLQIMGVFLEQRYTSMSLTENLCWLITKEQQKIYKGKAYYRSPLVSSYLNGGYTILRSKDRKVMIGMDHAELGLGSLAAHGHADALSVQLYYCGEPLLVDSGTYNYHISKSRRMEVRSTRAHNTVAVQNVEQAEILGPFLWGKRYVLEKVIVEELEDCVKLKAIISYSGIVHTRSLVFDYNRKLIVEDLVTGTDSAGQVWNIDAENSRHISIQYDDRLKMELESNRYSDVYGKEKPSRRMTIRFSEFVQSKISIS